MARLKMPEVAGTIGTEPAVEAKSLRVDFEDEAFRLAIEQKGYRVVWERCARCPCTPISSETSNPDPTCPQCKGTGFYYFGPLNYVIDATKAGKFNELQQSIIDASGGAVIRAIMTDIQAAQQPYQQVASWMEGASRVTVQHENTIGYLDRITNLDATIVFHEVVELKNPAQGLVCRYPVVSVNNLATMSKRYQPAEFNLTDDGRITFVSPPVKGTRFSINYFIYPRWLIVTYPHVVRQSWGKKKRKPNKLQTPVGDLMPLPMQGMIQYDFLVGGRAVDGQ